MIVSPVPRFNEEIVQRRKLSLRARNVKAGKLIKPNARFPDAARP